MKADSEQMAELARMLDVEPEDVVDTVGSLLVFNDQANAQIIHGEIAERDASAESQSMVRALLSDIAAARHMLRHGADASELLGVLTVLEDRVRLRCT